MSTPAPAQTPTKVKVGVLFLGGATHIYAAQKLGYFQRENLDVELRSLGGGAQVVPLLVSGDVNVGMINQVSWMLALAQGYDIVAVAATSAERKTAPYANNIFVVADSAIHSAKDLEGKRIATNTLNNILTLYGNEWARKHGADAKKLQWTEVPFPQMPDTLDQQARGCGVHRRAVRQHRQGHRQGAACSPRRWPRSIQKGCSSRCWPPIAHG